jgi:hypothetical protein
MKPSSTLFLRIAVYAMGLIVLALSIFILPIGIREDSGGLGLVFWVMYATVVPFFVALYQTLRLLNYIDTNTAFSNASVSALKIIKFCAFTISVLYAISLPNIYDAVQDMDAPGVMVVGLILTCTPLVIGIFAAVLQRVLQSAITIKSENDLTV